MSRSTFTITYEPRELAGQPGFDWAIIRRGVRIAEGWSRGKRKDAEQDARAVIATLERNAA